jgi:hypothetical protein
MNVPFIFQISYLLHVNRVPLGKSSYIIAEEAWKQAGKTIWNGNFPNINLFFLGTI